MRNGFALLTLLLLAGLFGSAALPQRARADVPAAAAVPLDPAPSGLPAVGDPLTELRSARDEIARLRAGLGGSTDTHERMMAYSLGIAAALKVLLSLLMKIKSPPPVWRDRMPYVLLAVGAAITVAVKFGGGGSWFDALLVGGGGPLAVLVNELHVNLPAALTMFFPPGAAAVAVPAAGGAAPSAPPTPPPGPVA